MKRSCVVLSGLVLLIVLASPPKAQSSSFHLDTSIIGKDATYYIVKRGDTLSKIAGNMFDDWTRWREIWKLNPRVSDPNKIHPGQKIMITKSEPAHVHESYIREAQKRAIFETMCQRWRVPCLTPFEADKRLGSLRVSIVLSRDPYATRRLMDEARVVALILELHKLTEAIMRSTTEDTRKSTPLLLAAIAWTETSFFNQKGNHGELSCFQVRPTTAKMMDPKSSMSQIKAKLEYDPHYAASLARDYLLHLKSKRTWWMTVRRYNGRGDNNHYAVKVHEKFEFLKRAARRKLGELLKSVRGDVNKPYGGNKVVERVYQLPLSPFFGLFDKGAYL